MLQRDQKYKYLALSNISSQVIFKIIKKNLEKIYQAEQEEK